MSFTLGEMHKICGYHYFFLSPSNYYSLEILSAGYKDCCECLLVCPRDGNLNQNWDPRVGKLTYFENWKCQISLGLPTPTPMLGQTIDRCITLGISEFHSQVQPKTLLPYTSSNKQVLFQFCPASESLIVVVFYLWILLLTVTESNISLNCN